MKENIRMTRINELLKREIANILEKIIDRKSGSLVSVTEVKTTPDLKFAKVYISILGPLEPKKEIFKSIQKNRAFIQSSIASVIRIKYTPVLHFTIDERFEDGDKVISMINDMEHKTEL
ncbi:MAG: 30S ribosome-binding factor RbfA [Lentisphaerota bacterium]